MERRIELATTGFGNNTAAWSRFEGPLDLPAETQGVDGDPVVWVWQAGAALWFEDTVGGGATETFSLGMSPGTYVIEVHDNSIVFGANSGTECFDVSIN